MICRQWRDLVAGKVERTVQCIALSNMTLLQVAHKQQVSYKQHCMTVTYPELLRQVEASLKLGLKWPEMARADLEAMAAAQANPEEAEPYEVMLDFARMTSCYSFTIMSKALLTLPGECLMDLFRNTLHEQAEEGAMQFHELLLLAFSDTLARMVFLAGVNREGTFRVINCTWFRDNAPLTALAKMQHLPSEVKHLHIQGAFLDTAAIQHSLLNHTNLTSLRLKQAANVRSLKRSIANHLLPCLHCDWALQCVRWHHFVQAIDMMCLLLTY